MRTLALLFLPLLSAFAFAADRPNIIVILADDQGWGDLSLHGNKNLRTPHLDRLAQEGLQFDNFYVQPVCSPTRAEFLTGRYYPRGGVYDTGAGGERLDADEQTIAEIFKEAGYATAAFGKWHNGTQAPYHPNTRGFDEYYGFTSGHWGSYFSPMLDHNGTIVTGEGYLPDDLTDHTISFLETKAKEGKPFFAYLAMPTPHSPMQTTDEDWERFKDRELESRHRDPEKERLDHTRAALAMVENIDWNVGRLMDRIQSLGISDNTIVVYFSDNGPNGWRWNGGMRGRKGSTDEGGVRSPLFIRWSGHIQPGKRIATVAADIDLLPTLAELAGVSWTPRHPLDGISLAKAVRSDSSEEPDRIVFSYWGQSISARSQRFSLDAEGKLYDIQNDREQSADVSARFPEVTARLKSAVEDWRREVVEPAVGAPKRPLTVGYPGLATTQLPARDASWTGAIERSNRWPNCSYLLNWSKETDTIFWDAEVGLSGAYRAVLYYTCSKQAEGTRVKLTALGDAVSAVLSQPHDPPAYGMEHDRVEREESYVKDFAPIELGVLELEAGPQRLELSAAGIPQGAAIEFRMLLLDRL